MTMFDEVMAEYGDQPALFDLPPQPESDLHFYLGTPEPSWLWRAYGLPLFVSHRRLRRLVNLRRATTPCAIDSGGFYEIGKYGRWTINPRTYIAAVARYDREIGCMEWAAPQDWMCEPQMIHGGVVNGQRFVGTGLTVAEHQLRTVANFLELRALWPEYSDDTCPVMPVLQGYTIDEYVACVQLYAAHDVDLTAEPLVGLGSVCRREDTSEISAVIRAVTEALPDVPLHGFGVKAGGIGRYGHLLASADSQAWSRGARYRAAEVRTPDCTHAGPCTWCPHHALAWREDVLAAAGRPPGMARFLEHYPTLAEWLDARHEARRSAVAA